MLILQELYTNITTFYDETLYNFICINYNLFTQFMW